MNKILFPTDFSENAHNAFAFFIKMFGHSDVEYVLLNAFNLPHSGRGMILSINDILQQESENGLKKERAYLIEKFGILENKIKIISEMGAVGESVAKVIDREKMELVVIGTKGASGLKSVLIGSNAADVISNVESPVLMIPDEHHFKSLKHVVFAADYTPNKTSENLKPLLSLVAKYNSKVSLLHVKKQKSKISQTDRESEQKNLSLIFSGTEYSFVEVENDNTSSGIREFLSDNDVNLLCMIPRKKGFFEKLFNSSISENMAKLANVPLLTLRE